MWHVCQLLCLIRNSMCDYSDVACDFLCLLCCDLTFRMIIAVDSPSSSQELLISQEMTTSWVFKGERHYRYEVRVKNNSAKTLQSLKLLVMDLHGPLWGLSKTGPMTYTFPTWMKSLTSKQSFVFIYIQSLPSNATISIIGAVFT